MIKGKLFWVLELLAQLSKYETITLSPQSIFFGLCLLAHTSSETSTAMAYSGNVVQTAMYPAAVTYRRHKDEPPTTSGVIIVSDDTKHCNQQVCRFEAMIMEELRRREPGLDIQNLNRWSDQCASQFKSAQNTAMLLNTAERLGLPGDGVIRHEFGETNEFKVPNY